VAGLVVLQDIAVKRHARQTTNGNPGYRRAIAYRRRYREWVCRSSGILRR
jgi:hypothetical protein